MLVLAHKSEDLWSEQNVLFSQQLTSFSDIFASFQKI